MSHVIDKRDQQIFPLGGWLRKISGEVAGLFGDAKFVKLETDWQYNKSVFNNKLVSLGFTKI
jgi:outer membrane protein assembly factor BamA